MNMEQNETPKICSFFLDWIEAKLTGTIICAQTREDIMNKQIKCIFRTKASMCITYMKGENKEAAYNTRHCGRILLGGHGTVTKHLRFVSTSMIGSKEKLLRRLCVPKQERTQ